MKRMSLSCTSKASDFPSQHPKNTRISLICQVLYHFVVDQQASLIQRVLKTFFLEQILWTFLNMRTHHHYLLRRLCDQINRNYCLLTEEISWEFAIWGKKTECGPASSSLYCFFHFLLQLCISQFLRRSIDAHFLTIMLSALKASPTNRDNRLQKYGIKSILLVWLVFHLKY